MKAPALCAALLLALLADERPAHAREDGTRRFTMALDASLGRSWLYGVAVDTYDVRPAMGFSMVRDQKVVVDWLFGTTLTRGTTEAGRAVAGFDLITFSSIAHVRAFRFGGAVHLGGMSVQRSAAPDSQFGPLAGVDAIVGVAFSVFYLDARLQVRAWLGGMSGASLAVGVRY